MDSLTFVANLVGSLAWPGALVLLLIIFRKPIMELLPLLQRLRYKEFELEFGKRIEEVKEEVARQFPSEPAMLGVFLDEGWALARLAEVSPRSAVLEAWRDVELAALDAARAIGGESFRHKTTYEAIQLLERAESFDRNLISLLRDLRGLRNEAAHVPEFALTKESALEYASTAAALARYLRRVSQEAGK